MTEPLLERVGLLSDSHGRAEITRRAVDRLLENGAEVLVHLGDVETVQVLDALAVARPGGDEQMPAYVVFGNTDYDSDRLSRYANDLGLIVSHPMGRLATPRGVLAFCHGHQPRLLSDALAEPVAYLCHGHTHRAKDERHGRTRVINPGALFRARPKTVALLDAKNDRLRFLQLPEPA